MLSIGEFSRATGLTVKALRFYHDEGVLAPAEVDSQTGYRYYREEQVERARAIAFLRSMEFPLAEIREILQGAGDDGDLLAAMRQHKTQMRERAAQPRRVVRALDEFIQREQEAKAMSERNYPVEEKVLPAQLVGGIRMKGRYCDCGKGFARLGRSLGRHISGKPMLLHYDTEFKEEDADFETCVPLRQAKAVDGVSVRELPGGKAVTLVHQGPYDELGQSYGRILGYIKEKGYRVASPSREVYIKGPGMIFKGNPRKYLTEIQMMIEA